MKLGRLVAFFYIWIIIEGIFRKWIFPSLTNELHLVKYAISFYIFVQVNKHFRDVEQLPFKNTLYAFVLICVFSFIYSLAANGPFVAIIGIMDYIAFVPVIIALPLVITSTEQIRKIFDVLTVISIAVFILGIIQYLSPPTAFINKYATNTEERNIDVATTSTGESFVRIATVFSYIGSSACYLYFAFIVLLVNFFQVQRRSAMRRNLNLMALGLACLNFFMTGSRVAVFIFLTLAAAFVIYKFRKNLQTNVFMYVVSFLCVGLFLITYLNVGKTAVKSWTGRFESGEQNNEYSGRSAYLAGALFDRVVDPPGGLLGYGIGTEQNAATTLVKNDDIYHAEDESERVALELGPVGFIVWYLLIIEICIYEFRMFARTKNTYLKEICFGFAIFSLFAIVLLRQTVVNWTDNLEWWSVIGLMLAIQKIDKSEGISSSSGQTARI